MIAAPETPSALPAALQQVLPKWFLDRPALTEALYAAGVSATYTAISAVSILFGAAAQDGQVGSFGQFLAYASTHWFGALVGLIFPAIRGSQAFTKAAANPKAS